MRLLPPLFASFAALVLLAAAPLPSAVAAPAIDTLAGSAGAGPATSVAQTPTGLVLDGGRLLVSDETFAVVRAIDLATGDQTVIAGNGSKGPAGDGGPAVAGQLGGSGSGIGPQGIALAPDGDVLVADTGSSRIRRVDAADGTLSTAAGTGIFGPNGDGGPATEARLAAPYATLALADGTILIADTSGNRVRRVDPATGTITTIAGTGMFGSTGDGGPATEARLAGPRGLALAGDGDLLIADTAGNRVRRVDSETQTITTYAGSGATSGDIGDGGAATAARLNRPAGLAVDAAGDLFIADRDNHRIRRVSATDGTISTAAGTGTAGFSGDGDQATAAQLASPAAVAVGGGRLFVADTGNRRVRAVGPDGTISTVAGNGTFGFRGDGGPAAKSQIFSPFGVTVGPDGDTYVADTVNHRIRRVDAETGAISTVAGSGTQCPPAGQPPGAPTPACGDGGPATEAQLSRPFDVAVDPDGNVLFIDNNLRRVRRVDATSGQIDTIAGTGQAGFVDGPGASAQFNEPQGLGIDPAGTRLLVAEPANNRLREVDLTSAAFTVSTLAGSGAECADPETPCGDGGPALTAQLTDPVDAAFLPDGGVVVADPSTRRVRRIAPDGTIERFAGTGETGAGGDGGPARDARFRGPRGLAVAPDGDVLVTDPFDHRVRRIDAATGTIAAWAGAGRPGSFAGDGAPAEQAKLNEPWSAAVSADGSVLIADRANNRVRRVAPPPADPGPGEITPPGGDDGTGGGTPDTRGDGRPGAQPAPDTGRRAVARRRARLAFRIRRRAGRRLVISGRLRPPGNIRRGIACRGTLLVIVRRAGGAPVAVRETRIGRRCGFATSLALPRGRRLPAGARVRVGIRFEGNSILRAARVSRRAKSR